MNTDSIKSVNDVMQEVLTKILNKEISTVPKFINGRYNKHKCLKCGEVLIWEDEEGHEHYEECSCRRKSKFEARTKRFEKISIIDREENKNTFANAKLETEQEKEIFDKAIRYCKNFEKFKNIKKGLMLYGTTGAGKTYLANCICNNLKAKGYSVLSFNLSGYLRMLEDNFRTNETLETTMLEAVKECDLLFIDDIGAEQINRKNANGSTWREEKIFNLIDTRDRAGKPLIITTNLSPEALRRHLENNGVDRIYSRIAGLTSPVQMNFKDRRMEA